MFSRKLGPALKKSHVSCPSISTSLLLYSYHYFFFYFTDEESEVSRQEITHERAASIELEREWKPRPESRI